MAKRNGTWEVVEAVNEELRARNRRQSAVAALGQTAIRSRDLAALLNEATAVTAETLGTDFASLDEWLPGEGNFRLRASVGCREGLVGSTVAAHDASMAAFMLRSDEPVVVADARTESRFIFSPVALEHGVVSAVGVVVRSRVASVGRVCRPLPARAVFGPDEIGFLQSVANVLSLAVERHEVGDGATPGEGDPASHFRQHPGDDHVHDASGRLLHVNREWERTLRVDDRRGATDRSTSWTPIPIRSRREEALEFVQRAASRWVDFRPRTRDGRVIDMSWARFELSDGTADRASGST